VSLGQYLADKLIAPLAGGTVVWEEVGGPEAAELAPALVTGGPRINRRDALDRLPMVSVVLTTRNGVRLLPEALRALAGQTYPVERYDLVVVDCGSTDGTPRILEEFAARAPFRITVEFAGGVSDIAARNLGARLASGDILAFTDQDCRVPPEWVQAGVNGFQRNVGFVAGPIFAKPEQRISFFSFVTQQTSDNGVYAASNVFYRRSLFLEEGGFGERLDGAGRPAWGWDVTAAWGLLRKGYQVRFRPEAYSYHHVHHLGLRPWLVAGWHARMVPPMLRDVPELRRSLLAGRVFYTRESAMFEFGLLGVAVALTRRRWRWLLLWLPWLGLVMDLARGDWWPPHRWLKLPIKAALLFVQHAGLVAGLAQGSVRARRIVL
jgi:glycosyltransferase involved in cell wall biosynthesis